MDQWVQLILAGSAAALAAYLFLAPRREKKNKQSPELQVIELNRVVQDAELMNNGFFRSLELVQKNLESLLARATSAEQKLSALIPQAQAGRADRYAKAASMLAGGKQKAEVSQTLGLPLLQVRLIEELRREAGIAAANKISTAAQPEETNPSSKERRPAERAEMFPRVAWEQYAAGREKFAAGANGAGR